MLVLSKRSLGRLEGVNPILIDIIEDGIKESPYDFAIPPDGGRRSAERQNELFKEGKSKCDGYKTISYHQTGNAFDIFISENGKASWEVPKLKAVALHLISIAKSKGVTLIWGGNWKSFKDAPHFEIRK